jgi:ABC-type sugar transport system ATPase subunit
VSTTRLPGNGAVDAIEATALHMSYPGVQALQGVNFTVAAGEVRALLGKNGAGKSTLVKILSGAETPDAGALQVAGRMVDVFTPGYANALGVATVHQELSLVPELSVADNILLGRWRSHRRRWLIDQQAMRCEAAAVLAEFGVQIDPATKVRKLSIAQQQLVEIARGLSFMPKVLITDQLVAGLGSRHPAANHPRAVGSRRRGDLCLASHGRDPADRSQRDRTARRMPHRYPADRRRADSRDR